MNIAEGDILHFALVFPHQWEAEVIYRNGITLEEIRATVHAVILRKLEESIDEQVERLLKENNIPYADVFEHDPNAVRCGVGGAGSRR